MPSKCIYWEPILGYNDIYYASILYLYVTLCLLTGFTVAVGHITSKIKLGLWVITNLEL